MVCNLFMSHLVYMRMSSRENGKLLSRFDPLLKWKRTNYMINLYFSY